MPSLVTQTLVHYNQEKNKLIKLGHGINYKMHPNSRDFKMCTLESVNKVHFHSEIYSHDTSGQIKQLVAEQYSQASGLYQQNFTAEAASPSLRIIFTFFP